ncbi:hypothetical protein EVAR_6411_1 [Eumeta japonica]|uniref:Uncharacterized protein n=1 Tax=Eumeta variegata TaxID=151549 RepID=A0A4C1TF83_EUMVA|nr:hypothetical protein EVAR_6411_1 [Eumeta japonica]
MNPYGGLRAITYIASRFSSQPIDFKDRRVTSALPAFLVGIEYVIEGNRGDGEGVDNRNSHKPDEMQQQKFHVYILSVMLRRSSRPIVVIQPSQESMILPIKKITC